MKIAITGSWRPEDQKEWRLRDQKLFAQAVSALGESLVRMGHQLVIATHSDFTADGAAVAGAARVQDARVPSVTVLSERRDLFPTIAAERPGFLRYDDPAPTAEVNKLHQVNMADAVFAAGGAEKTLQAIVAAAASGKRIVPMSCFGGAAAQARSVLSAMSDSWGPNVPSRDVLGVLDGTWSPTLNELALDALGVRAPQLLIVHGRDDNAVMALRKLVTDLGLPVPIVLKIEPDQGQTIPEKFEKLAVTVDAAIALVTPDDIGGLNEGDNSAFQSRARQNVWVEVGWFWGRLGRKRVMLLGKQGIEMPSDLSGLLVNEFETSPAQHEDKICQWVESLGWPKPTRRKTA